MTPIPETVPSATLTSGVHRPPLVASEVPAFLSSLAIAAGGLPPMFAALVQANVATAMNRLAVEALRVAGVEGVVGVSIDQGGCPCPKCTAAREGTPA